MRGAIRGLLWVLLAALPGACLAGLYEGNPTNHQSQLALCSPGDTLHLEAGDYTRLVVNRVNGTSGAWIVIRGDDNLKMPVIRGEGGYNTVQLDSASYVEIENLRIDGLGLDVDGINASGDPSNDILIENCVLVNFSNNQATVGISTKATTWNWTLRGNRIEDAGTGVYLGDSDGTAPFVNGLIEDNYVNHTIGYDMEIKHQIPYSLLTGMPAGPNRTIIRNNVFIKDETAPEAGARPNLLTGTFPASGPGASDLYEIYGNFIYHNPYESLLQATGRVSIHDNILVDPGSGYSAIYLTDHNGPLDYATVYNNTIYGFETGISFVNDPDTYGLLTGNMIFSATPIFICGGCTLDVYEKNVTDSQANADQYVLNPSGSLGAMDFYNRIDCDSCSGSALDLSPVSSDVDYDVDFNTLSKGSFAFRGAYAWKGYNDGWQLQDARKGLGVSYGPLDTLRAGYWMQAGTDSLVNHLPSPVPPGNSPTAIMNAWCGAAYDTKRGRLLVTGGGHGDYGGNEVYAFDVDTFRWSRIWGPSPYDDILAQQGGSCVVDAYADGNPVSRHTYDGLEYLPKRDSFWLSGGSHFCGAGSMGQDTWELDLATLSWTKKASQPSSSTAPPECAYDPITGHVFYRNYNRLYEYDPEANTWTSRSPQDGGYSNECAAAYDPKRQYFVLTGNGEVRYYDLSGGGSVSLQIASTSGDKTMESVQGPGFEYDPVADRMVAWLGGTDVYALNLDTWVWTKYTPAPGNTVTPTASPTAGTWGRWRYVPSKNVFMVVNAINGAVYFYKMPFITRIDMPLQEWVARPTPASGEGPCPGDCKHIRFAYDITDKKLWVNGGDYDGSGGFIQSGRQETWSYSLVDSTWTLEYPYCGPSGESEPCHPDETGFVYDMSRDKFWMIPGYMGADNGECSGLATMVRYEIMSFDPGTGDWTNEARTEMPGVTIGDNGFAHYDPDSDQVVMFYRAGNAGAGHYDIATDTWTKYNFTQYARLSKEYTAMDLKNRHIYAVDGYVDTLYRYDMDAHVLEAMCASPPGAGETRIHLVWDPVNEVVLWPDFTTAYSELRMNVYHPDTNTWDVGKPIVQRDGLTVFGNSVGFDPVQNVLVVMGDVPPSSQNFFIYRYGNGVGTVAEAPAQPGSCSTNPGL